MPEIKTFLTGLARGESPRSLAFRLGRRSSCQPTAALPKIPQVTHEAVLPEKCVAKHTSKRAEVDHSAVIPKEWMKRWYYRSLGLALYLCTKTPPLGL